MSSEQKMIIYKEHKFTVLYDLETLQKKVFILAQKINTHYRELLKEDKDSCIVAICVLQGGIVFFSDLIRLLEFPFEVDFTQLTNKKNGVSTQEITFLTKLDLQKLRGKHLLVVEDVVVTGKSLCELVKKLYQAEPKSIQIVALLLRTDQRPLIECKWIGLECTDYLIGYGMDFEEKFRNLPEIYQRI